MPVYFNAKDVISGNMPGIGPRAAMAKSPSIRSDIQVLIPESEYNRSFAQMARNAVDETANREAMGERDKIIRGIVQTKETYATLEIVEAGKLNSVEGDKFEEFLLQSSQEATQEKYQLVETFGETVGFFFGSRPKVYQYSGTLMNTDDYPWRDNWKEYYEQKLRGTKLVEAKKRAYLTYDYVLREGYILSFNMAENAAMPNSLDFSFSMFITKEVNLNPSLIDAAEEANDLIAINESSSNDEMYEKAQTVYDSNIDNMNAAGEQYEREMGEKARAAQIGSPKEITIDAWKDAAGLDETIIPRAG